MTVYGYILIDGEKRRVSLTTGATRRKVRRRRTGADGEHLVDVQTFLEQPEHVWLLDAFRHGTAVYIPLEVP